VQGSGFRAQSSGSRGWDSRGLAWVLVAVGSRARSRGSKFWVRAPWCSSGCPHPAAGGGIGYQYRGKPSQIPNQYTGEPSRIPKSKLHTVCNQAPGYWWPSAAGTRLLQISWHPQTLNPDRSTLNPKPSTLNPKHSVQNPTSRTPTPQPKTAGLKVLGSGTWVLVAVGGRNKPQTLNPQP